MNDLRKAAQAGRMQGKVAYSPTPLASGWATVLFGLSIMFSPVLAWARRILFTVQGELVYKIYGVRNYPRAYAHWVWAYVILYTTAVISIVIGLLRLCDEV